MKPLVFTSSDQTPHNGSSVCSGYYLSGKRKAVVEPVSLTDEQPARNSAGRVIRWSKVCHTYLLFRFGITLGRLHYHTRVELLLLT
jgi:hypothetical protein